MLRLIFLLICIFTNTFLCSTSCASIAWNAKWIAPNESEYSSYGVYHFQKEFELIKKNKKFVIHITADNRFKLFVNEKLIALGPSIGSIKHWNYETIDIANFLVKGKNAIRVLVWNDGDYKPIYQFSVRTALLVQGESPIEHIVNTNQSWVYQKFESYLPLKEKIPAYYVVGPGEFLNMNIMAGEFKNATIINLTPWQLFPSNTARAELEYQRFAQVRKIEGLTIVATKFPIKKIPLVIPAHSNVKMLLDQNYLTNAFLNLKCSKGKNASIRICYAESLFDTNNSKYKYFRNDVVNKMIIGRRDSILFNGSVKQHFTNLNWRTFRYVELSINTQNEPLIIEDIYSESIRYPFTKLSNFSSNNQLIDSILSIGWRTAQLCAVETYMDCPYYEQLQYVGDTRIQALISYYNCNDDKLARKAIEQLASSQQENGLLYSRYPSNEKQLIPTFSLIWIGMLHDFYLYRTDTEFIRGQLPTMRKILKYFANYEQENGLLLNVPDWKFTDWSIGGSTIWKRGQAPASNQGFSAAIDLQHLMALQWAATLETDLGSDSLGMSCYKKANALKKEILLKYWDSANGLFADNEDFNSFSEQVNVLAVLSEIIEGQNAIDLLNKTKQKTDITRCSIYFKYYLNQALYKVELGKDYLQNLDIWKSNIAYGLTTWAEDSFVEKSRSDCHAWGSSPNIEFLRIVLGIDTNSPSFSSVKITPHPGDLKNLAGKMPHPKGLIAVHYKQKRNGKWEFDISLPKSVEGVLNWQGSAILLVGGKNKVVL
jgi:hypothetical protein